MGDALAAGNKETRKSASGGVLKVGKRVIRTWSSTQPTVATSSGEAELIAMYDGATRGLGMRTVMAKMGLSPQDPLNSTSTSALETISAAHAGEVRGLAWLETLGILASVGTDDMLNLWTCV